MEEQIGYGKIVSGQHSKLDASFAKLDASFEKLGATFDKIDEQLAFFKSTLQTFIKVRFDIDINFDAQDQSDVEAHNVFDEMSRTTCFSVIEDQRSLADVDGENKDEIDGAKGQLPICDPELQCDYGQVLLEDEAANMFDEMSTSASPVVMKDQQALVSREKEINDEISGETIQLLSSDPERKCDSSINLGEVNTHHDAIYSQLQDGFYLVVRDTHSSLSKAKCADVVEVLYINHENILLGEGKWFLNTFYNAEILESRMFMSNATGRVYEQSIGRMLLSRRKFGTLSAAYVLFHDGVMFPFDPGRYVIHDIHPTLEFLLHKIDQVTLLTGEYNAGRILLAILLATWNISVAALAYMVKWEAVDIMFVLCFIFSFSCQRRSLHAKLEGDLNVPAPLNIEEIPSQLSDESDESLGEEKKSSFSDGKKDVIEQYEDVMIRSRESKQRSAELMPRSAEADAALRKLGSRKLNLSYKNMCQLGNDEWFSCCIPLVPVSLKWFIGVVWDFRVDWDLEIPCIDISFDRRVFKNYIPHSPT